MPDFLSDRLVNLREEGEALDRSKRQDRRGVMFGSQGVERHSRDPRFDTKLLGVSAQWKCLCGHDRLILLCSVTTPLMQFICGNNECRRKMPVVTLHAPQATDALAKELGFYIPDSHLTNIVSATRNDDDDDPGIL